MSLPGSVYKNDLDPNDRTRCCCIVTGTLMQWGLAMIVPLFSTVILMIDICGTDVKFGVVGWIAYESTVAILACAMTMGLFFVRNAEALQRSDANRKGFIKLLFYFGSETIIYTLYAIMRIALYGNHDISDDIFVAGVNAGDERLYWKSLNLAMLPAMMYLLSRCYDGMLVNVQKSMSDGSGTLPLTHSTAGAPSGMTGYGPMSQTPFQHTY